MSILEKLIEEDFGFTVNGTKWGRAKEHNSLVVNREKQIFFWNSEENAWGDVLCGDAFVYLTKVRKLSDETAKEYLKKNEGTNTYIHEIKKGKETITYPALVEIFHENLLKGDKTYFYKRTITDETISRYKLGMYEDWYTIPIYQDGIFRQFQLRKDKPAKDIKGYYEGIGPLLYNSEIMKVTNEIVFTEGPTSCLVLNQNGIPAVSMNTGAGGFQEEWFPYFMHQKTIYVLFDNDKAGKLGAIRIAKLLGQYRTRIYNFEDFGGEGYDANDFFIQGGTKKDLLRILDKKTRLIFEKGT